MAQKKDRSRFSIKFRENDPAHERTICILESQGQRNIAPFLVNAVLHYVQCSETPDISHMLAEEVKTLMDKNAVEDLVKEILRKQGIIKEETKIQSKTEAFETGKVVWNKKEEISSESIESQKIVNDDIRAMIASTLSALRND